MESDPAAAPGLDEQAGIGMVGMVGGNQHRVAFPNQSREAILSSDLYLPDFKLVAEAKGSETMENRAEPGRMLGRTEPVGLLRAESVRVFGARISGPQPG